MQKKHPPKIPSPKHDDPQFKYTKTNLHPIEEIEHTYSKTTDRDYEPFNMLSSNEKNSSTTKILDPWRRIDKNPPTISDVVPQPQ